MRPHAENTRHMGSLQYKKLKYSHIFALSKQYEPSLVRNLLTYVLALTKTYSYILG